MLNHSLVPVGSTGYDIDNSLRFNNDDSAYLDKVFSSDGDRQTWTFSCWYKRTRNGTSTSNRDIIFASYGGTSSFFQFGFVDDKLMLYEYETPTDYGYRTTSVYRDSSAWYHITLVWDTQQAATTNRVKLYVNGEQVSFPQVYGDVPQSYTSKNINRASYPQQLCRYQDQGLYSDGYLSEVNFVDGQALTPADFGETDEDYGHWKAKAYEGTYGTNGFYLDFKNSGSLGNDASSNSNNWTPNNLAATDQMLDSPTNNFATLNPLDTIGAASILLEGNLEQTSTASAWGSKAATFGMSSGKWYWEYVITASAAGPTGGIVTEVVTSGDLAVAGAVFCNNIGWIYDEGVATTTGGITYSIGDVISCTYDADAGVFKQTVSNGTYNTIASGKSGREWFPVSKVHQTADSINHNFGQDSSFAGNKTSQGNADGNGYGDFYYAPPTGYLALCTQNLPEPTVVPSEHFNTVLYTGTGAAQDIDLGMTSDFSWIKVRSTTGGHGLFDNVRLSGGTYYQLQSNTTSAESSSPWIDDVGTVLGLTGAGYNTSSVTYVAWNWKANGAGVSNTNGSITSTVSANADAGFSIVSWVGTETNSTIGHGLTSAPEMIIVKGRETTEPWFVYHITTGNTDRLQLNSTTTPYSSVQYWNNTTPANDVFTVGINDGTNDLNNEMIAYAFHSVEGYSKVGSYTGNGSTDGPFVHCGFRPAYVMWKRTDALGNWHIFDNARDTYNLTRQYLIPNTSGAEVDGTSRTPDITLDLLSNGFKWINNNGNEGNVSGGTFIYLAFAEHPFKYTNAR